MQGSLLRHSPRASSSPFQLSMPSRICPIDSSKNIFTGQLLQGCREGSGAGRARARSQPSPGCHFLPGGWLKMPLEQSLVLCRDQSCLFRMARTAAGTQTSPFTVRAVPLHFCISPGAEVSKRIPSFGSGEGLDPILLQSLWLPRGD